MHVGSSEETVSGTRVIPETADGCRTLAPCRGTGVHNPAHNTYTLKCEEPLYQPAQ